MASKFDQSFIDNLQSFTDALESIVELMQKQQDKGGDAVNALSSGIDAEKINQITEQIKSINDNIDSKTKQILDEIKASRKQKESGLFDKVENKENKNKIVDGIKTVILIAGGVLSIGMAFKIIGKVDFLSVIALSAGMMMVAHAFSEIAKIKELTPQKSLMVGLALIVIAGAITISSFILQGFRPLGPLQMLSFIIVSAGLGIGAFFIFKAVKSMNIKPEDTWKFLLLPLILPAIAMGIVASSWILKDIQPIGFMQALSAIFIGLALAAGSIAVYFVMKALKGKEGSIDLKGIGLALLVIPGIAMGIVGASWIFQGFLPIGNPFQLIFGSLSMGIAMIAFLPAVYILGKMKIEDMLTGVIGAVLLSGAIAISSIIINEGVYDGAYPNWKWSLGVGLSLIFFAPAVWVLGHLKPQQLLMGGLGAIIVSVAIMASSWIINAGNYSGNYPNWKWALGVGLSLIMFTPAIVVLGIIAMSGIGALAILAGAGMTLVVAAAIVSVSHILGLGDYNNFPSAKWAAGVGLSMILFTPALVMLGLLGPLVLIGALFSMAIASSIVQVSSILSKGNYDIFPSAKWSAGVGLSLLLITPMLVSFAILGPLALVGSLFIIGIATSIVQVSSILNKGNFNVYPSEKWTSGVGLSLLSITPMLVSFAILGPLALVGSLFVIGIVSAIVEVSNILSKGNFKGGPTQEWISGLNESIISFINISSNIGLGDVIKSKIFMKNMAQSMVEVADILSKGNFNTGPNNDWATQLVNIIDIFVNKVPEKSQLRKLQEFIEVIKDFGGAVNKIKQSGIDKLSQLTASVTIMSVIDNQKLQSVLKVIDTNKDKFSNAIEGREMSKSENIKQTTTEVVKTAFGGGEKVKDKQDIMIERFDTVIKKFDELLEYVISEGGPENTGKNDSTKR
jgi:hypothetical protein